MCHLLQTRVICILGTLALHGALLPQALAMGPHRPERVMVSLGDSISAGTFANTRDWHDAPVALPQEARLDLRRWLKFLLLPWLETKSTLAWSTGEKTNSHWVRLKASLEKQGYSPQNMQAWNLSVPGSKSEHLFAQLDELEKKLKDNGNPGVEYLTLTVGGNDACDSTEGPWVPDEVFEKNLDQLFHRLGKILTDQNTRILVAAIPPIPRTGAEEFWSDRPIAGVECRTIRTRVFRFCPNLVNWRNAQEFDERMEQIRRKNQILEDAIQVARAAYPNLQFAFGASLADARFSPQDLALDCFHPNQSGQSQIADLLWADQPWY